MPALSPSDLIDAILSAIEESGESAMLVSNTRTHPRKFAVNGATGSSSLWVYAWTLTPGGRPQLKDEYRIQMTSVSSPLQINPFGYTALLGFEPSLKMFAGFDLGRHQTFTTGSPSVQISITSLHKALQDGLAFHRKDNNEIAVGIRPDQFMTYIYHAPSLHKYGKQKSTFEALAKASSLVPIEEIALGELTNPRQRVVQTVSRLSRAANFREQVLNAYGHRCAVTRCQLRLVEAAHILPAAVEGSIDHVVNGISLSPTYHKAFDSGLIYLDSEFSMRINPRKLDDLAKLKLDGGIDQFRSFLGKIHLPADRHQWPDVRMVGRANRYRGIEG
jgi:putative restriction endonuclease